MRPTRRKLLSVIPVAGIAPATFGSDIFGRDSNSDRRKHDSGDSSSKFDPEGVIVTNIHRTNRSSTVSGDEIRFIEEPSQHTVTVQTSVTLENSCEYFNYNVTPTGGKTGGNPIIVELNVDSEKGKMCAEMIRHVPVAIEISMENVVDGQEIAVVGTNTPDISYTTTGRKNAVTKPRDSTMGKRKERDKSYSTFED